MKVYTKSGDQGKTALVDGSSIAKDHIRLEAYGTVDELASHLGLLQSHLTALTQLTAEAEQLQKVQLWLFHLGSQLACSDPKISEKLPTLTTQDITFLESAIDQWDSELPPLKNFIFPGGHTAAAQAHVCRTVCRRAERSTVLLFKESSQDTTFIPFLNRLSDYFFQLARIINFRMGVEDIQWKPQ